MLGIYYWIAISFPKEIDAFLFSGPEQFFNGEPIISPLADRIDFSMPNPWILTGRPIEVLKMVDHRSPTFLLFTWPLHSRYASPFLSSFFVSRLLFTPLLPSLPLVFLAFLSPHRFSRDKFRCALDMRENVFSCILECVMYFRPESRILRFLR